MTRLTMLLPLPLLVACPGPKGDTADTSPPTPGVYALDNTGHASSIHQYNQELSECLNGRQLPPDLTEDEFISGLSILGAKLINTSLMPDTQGDYITLCQDLIERLRVEYSPPPPYPPGNCPEEFTSTVFNITKHPEENHSQLAELEKMTLVMDGSQYQKEQDLANPVEGCWVALDLAGQNVGDNAIYYALMYAAYHFETASTLKYSGPNGVGVTSVYGLNFTVSGDPVDVSQFDDFFKGLDLNPPAGLLEISIGDVKFGDVGGSGTADADVPSTLDPSTAECVNGDTLSTHTFDLCTGSSPSSVIDPANQADVTGMDRFADWAIQAELEGQLLFSFQR